MSHIRTRAWWLDGDTARDFDASVGVGEDMNGPTVEFRVGSRRYLIPVEMWAPDARLRELEAVADAADALMDAFAMVNAFEINQARLRLCAALAELHQRSG